MYLLSARLCVLSAQHMNTRSHNVYAEKHMFDFYNKFLRIFQTCVRLYKDKTNKCVYVLIRISENFFEYMNVCSHDTWKQWNVYTFLNFSNFPKFSKTLITNLFKSFLKLYLLYSIYLYTSIKPSSRPFLSLLPARFLPF